MSADTIPDRLRRRAQLSPELPALGVRGPMGWTTTTFGDYQDRVTAFGRALLARGLRPGDRVAILGENRPDWVLMALGAMAVGAVPFGIYATSTADEIHALLEHSGARLALCETTDHRELLLARGRPEALETVVMMSGARPVPEPTEEGPLLASRERFLSDGESVPAGDVDAATSALRPDQLATLIYTSGTTGRPKGVMLTHRNLAWTADRGPMLVPLAPGDRSLSYLPLSHIAEQMFTIHIPITAGTTVYFATTREKVPEHLVELRPTLFFGVPRVWEKIQARIQARLDEAPHSRRWALDRAMAVAGAAHRTTQSGRRLSAVERRALGLARRLVLDKVKARLGLDRARTCLSGAAPLDEATIDFFRGLDLPILEIYGQSEGTGPTTFNRPRDSRPGTVGRAIPGVTVALDEDGEVLVRGGNVAAGYLDDPDATRETFEDGRLRTGDLGELDGDGFLKIVGRKKDLIVTAGGKNVAPRPIEESLARHGLVDAAMVVGDRRPYLVALLTLEPEAAGARAERLGVAVGELARHPAILAELRRHVDRVNEGRARVMGVKRFAVVEPFSTETGELTPTLKLKRRVVEERHAKTIARLYDEV